MARWTACRSCLRCSSGAASPFASNVGRRRPASACHSPYYGNRRFAANDVVFLDELRCDGRGPRRLQAWLHDLLERGLAPVMLRSTEPPTSTRAPRGVDALLRRLKTKTDENHYFCQSTQLYDATEAFPGDHRLWMLRIAWREISNGDRSASEILKFLVLWSRLRLLHRLLLWPRAARPQRTHAHRIARTRARRRSAGQESRRGRGDSRPRSGATEV